jgi:RNA polymerase sigma-70 factor (ECF subfamily)
LEPPAPAADPAPELRAALAAAVAALPPPQRSVFVLRECHALSYEEIAAVEETDVGTVKSRLFRARLALQERLRDQLDDDERRSRERRANV